MQVGDLIEITDWRGLEPDDRSHGIVCSIKTHHPGCGAAMTFVAEVMWDTGTKCWMEIDRIRIVSKDR